MILFFTLDDFDKGLYGLSIGPINKIIAAPTIDNKVKSTYSVMYESTEFVKQNKKLL